MLSEFGVESGKTHITHTYHTHRMNNAAVAEKKIHTTYGDVVRKYGREKRRRERRRIMSKAHTAK